MRARHQTCAEETLAKAAAALREKEEQLVHLRLQHDVLRAELAAVKEGLSTSTERAEKLQEEGQVSGVVDFKINFLPVKRLVTFLQLALCQHRGGAELLNSNFI